MEKNELIRRMEDLAQRCSRTSTVTSSGFLTPAESFEISQSFHSGEDAVLFLSGGIPDCERKVAFFLPYYLEKDAFSPDEYIHAVKIRSYFGEPAHRDYLGAILGLGIKREWIGDIMIHGDTAYVFCLPSVESTLLLNLDKVGRYGVKTQTAALSEVPAPVKKMKKVSFTVKSPRLDAVVGDLFGISRAAAADAIRLGLITLNYSVCEKVDREIAAGDILSFRGKGKGEILEIGGKSRKGRLFVDAALYL